MKTIAIVRNDIVERQRLPKANNRMRKQNGATLVGASLRSSRSSEQFCEGILLLTSAVKYSRIAAE